MTYSEILLWIAYFEKRPVGWKEDHRTYKLLQTQGVKDKPWDHFPSLKVIYQPDISKSLRNSFVYKKMLEAKDGDKLEILKDL